MNKLSQLAAAMLLLTASAEAAHKHDDGNTAAPAGCMSDAAPSLDGNASDGDPDGKYRLAIALLDGFCGAQDTSAAMRLLEEAAALGHAPAAFRLGKLNRDGDVIARDLNAAARYFRLAAEQDDMQAQHHLGLVLLWLAEADEVPFESLYWLGAAADAGDGLSAASLGILHSRGMYGIKKDVCIALDWFEAASLLGFRDIEMDHVAFLDAHGGMCN